MPITVYSRPSYQFPDSLYHFGIPDMEWGKRRFQYKDGTLTPEGKLRYRKGGDKLASRPKRTKEKSGVAKVLSNAGISIKKTAGLYIDRLKMNSKKRHPWMMSDSELAEVVNRMSMEQRLRDLGKDEKASRFINRTLKNVEDITVNNVKEFGRSFSNSSGRLIAEKMFGKKGKNGNGNDKDDKDDD